MDPNHKGLDGGLVFTIIHYIFCPLFTSLKLFAYSLKIISLFTNIFNILISSSIIKSLYRSVLSFAEFSLLQVFVIETRVEIVSAGM